MKIFLLLVFTHIIFAYNFTHAQANICQSKNIFSKIKDIDVFISKNIESGILTVNEIKGDYLKLNETIKTDKNKQTKIIFTKPFKLEFDVYPNSSIEIIKQSNSKCGPQIKLNFGKIGSMGNHLSQLSKICGAEIKTHLAEIIPNGTTYNVETGALSEALAELNNENGSEGANFSDGKYQEKYSVDQGGITVKLKKISKNKSRNKIKYTKFNSEKKIKGRKKIKSSDQYIAYNEKINIKAGSSLKVRKYKKIKKNFNEENINTNESALEQTAELEIFNPNGEN